jgi:hypothetical protein
VSEHSFGLPNLNEPVGPAEAVLVDDPDPAIGSLHYSHGLKVLGDIEGVAPNVDVGVVSDVDLVVVVAKRKKIRHGNFLLELYQGIVVLSLSRLLYEFLGHEVAFDLIRVFEFPSMAWVKSNFQRGIVFGAEILIVKVVCACEHKIGGDQDAGAITIICFADEVYKADALVGLELHGGLTHFHQAVLVEEQLVLDNLIHFHLLKTKYYMRL